MITRQQSLRTILSAADANGVGTSMNVIDFKHAIFSVDTDNSANLTIKFQGSIADEAPDFSAAQSATNQWDYIEVIDLEDGSAIDGDTGISPAGTDDNRMVEANINGLTYVNVIVSSRSAGDVTVKLRSFNNQ